MILGAICVMIHGDSALPSDRFDAGNHRTPNWPRRRHYVAAAILFTAVAIYGSLVPFGFEPLGLREAVEQFRHIPRRSLTSGGRADLVANILLSIPISYFWLAVLLVDRRSRLRAAVAVPSVVLFCIALAAALEFTQLWFPFRSVGLNDILAQGIGAVIGTSLWLTVGQDITDWIRTLTPTGRRKTYLDWLLQIYLLWLLVSSLRPLNLTISVSKLVHKYRQGRISLVPFSGMEPGFVLVCEALQNAALFIPVGMLAATWLTPVERPVRRLSTSVVLGGLVVVAIELGQVLVYSRPAATADVITGTLGVLVGAYLTWKWYIRGPDAPTPPPWSTSARRACLWLGLAGLYALVLVVVFCAPFEVLDDRREMWARFDGFFYIPFARHSQGSELYMISDILKKVLFFVPFGAALALAAGALSVPPSIRRIMLAGLVVAAAGFATSIEMVQVVLKDHVPDVTDTMLYTTGAAIGLFVVVRRTRPDQAKG